MTGPTVSIGMPVFNSKPSFFEAAIDSLLDQSFQDWELIISDNGSSPSAVVMYRRAAQRDPRIRYVRHVHNRGPTFNFHYLIHASTGRYFCWAADDDVRHPDYLKETAALLEQRPESVLVSTHAREIDPDGRPGAAVTFDARAASFDLGERIEALARLSYVVDIYGLFRRDFLARSAIVREAFHRDYWGADNVVVFAAMLAGPILRVPRELFCYRVKPENVSLTKNVLEQFGDSPRPVIEAERARAHHLATAVFEAPLPTTEKLALVARLALIINRSPYTNERKYMARYHFWKALRNDEYARALRMALTYWRLSPLAPFRPSAWRSIAEWRLAG